MEHAALIVAAGRGERAGSGPPKQYRPIGGRPMLARSIDALLIDPRITRLLVVIHPDHRADYVAATASIDDARIMEPVIGGAERAASVRAGLEALAPWHPDTVLIHDAARPFVSPRILDATIEALKTSHGVFPALPIVDALWQRTETGPLRPIDRTPLLRAQTPQAFRFAPIHDAHRRADPDQPATDDVALGIAAGLDIVSIDGEEANFKVTTKDDFARAEAAVMQRADIRTGQGYDVHAFTDGDAVTLCGITLPHDRALKGHSDADVALHAITDAIYGALAEGDIGQWFPPSDPQWKGTDSALFLEHAMGRIAARGFVLTHMDCTIVCEMPKIGPHARAMRERISQITGIAMDRISVKATTSERLGFTGRGEGIAALATVTLSGA